MPRAALLSIHARVAGVRPATWEHSSLVQLWGPRFNAYVVAAKDLAVFSLGRLPENVQGRMRAYDTANRLHAVLDGQRLPFGQAGRALGVVPNSLRYATATGRVLMRWDGARQPVIWTVPAPSVDPQHARLELARRYLHSFGPTTAIAFADWAGVRLPEAHAAFESLSRELLAVRTRWVMLGYWPMTRRSFEQSRGPQHRARLLPSGDTYYLLWGPDRSLLVPDSKHRAKLWTARVWPGALLIKGEIAGVWRRAGGEVSIEAWRRLSIVEREAAESEALTLPLPDLDAPIAVRWS
ncbi:MAG: winged helix DNA-binding domain-containing protein [Gammaproteobacteria bacterium]|nr:winged helix DNA-binding domain-containing protein [Gammaproteobacteria bacterium]